MAILGVPNNKMPMEGNPSNHHMHTKECANHWHSVLHYKKNLQMLKDELTKTTQAHEKCMDELTNNSKNDFQSILKANIEIKELKDTLAIITQNHIECRNELTTHQTTTQIREQRDMDLIKQLLKGIAELAEHGNSLQATLEKITSEYGIDKDDHQPITGGIDPLPVQELELHSPQPMETIQAL